MSKQGRKALSFVAQMERLVNAGINENRVLNDSSNLAEGMLTIQERIEAVIGVSNNKRREAGDMIFFVMYDIENNKVRTAIAKHLLSKGCLRIQKSIFLGDLDRNRFERLRSDLSEVQECYENEDSILIVPISTDYLQSMKIIGKSVDVDLILKNKNTLFF